MATVYTLYTSTTYGTNPEHVSKTFVFHDHYYEIMDIYHSLLDDAIEINFHPVDVFSSIYYYLTFVPWWGNGEFKITLYLTYF